MTCVSLPLLAGNRVGSRQAPGPCPLRRTRTVPAPAAAMLAFGLVSLSGQQRAFAQSIVEEGSHELTLQEMPDIEHGKAVILQGEADTDGDKFFIQNLFITQPVTVVLMAANPSRPLTLNLSKYRYDQSDRSGDTGSSGAVSFDFRTQGELKIHVKPKDPEVDEAVPYFLVAWAGDDVQPDLPPPVVVESAGVGDGGGLSSIWVWVLVIGLAAAALAFLSRRRTA